MFILGIGNMESVAISKKDRANRASQAHVNTANIELVYVSILFFFFFFFLLFTATPMAYGSSQARGRIEASCKSVPQPQQCSI